MLRQGSCQENTAPVRPAGSTRFPLTAADPTAAHTQRYSPFNHQIPEKNRHQDAEIPYGFPMTRPGIGTGKEAGALGEHVHGLPIPLSCCAMVARKRTQPIAVGPTGKALQLEPKTTTPVCTGFMTCTWILVNFGNTFISWSSGGKAKRIAESLRAIASGLRSTRIAAQVPANAAGILPDQGRGRRGLPRYAQLGLRPDGQDREAALAYPGRRGVATSRRHRQHAASCCLRRHRRPGHAARLAALSSKHCASSRWRMFSHCAVA